MLDFRPCDKLSKRYLGQEKILDSPQITPIDNGLNLSTHLETKLEKRRNVEYELFQKPILSYNSWKQILNIKQIII